MTETIDREERRINSVGGFEIRDVELGTKGKLLTQLSGIAVPYGVRTNIGWFDEEFKRGALKKSIGEAARSLPLLAFHDANSIPIGVAKEWHEETAGLRGVWQLEDDPRAQQLARMAKPDGDGHAPMGYMSVRFIPMQSSWTYAAPGSNERDYVLRTEARLVETSLVSTPAYAGAHVQWVRTADPALRSEARGHRLRGYEEMLDKLRAGPQL
jgi:HK97 family phage prohead protease